MDRDTVDEIKKEFRQQVGVLTEEFQSRLSAVVEGQESLRRDLTAKIEGLRSDMEREFEETRAMIRLSYRALEDRLGALESDMTDVKARLARVEARTG